MTTKIFAPAVSGRGVSAAEIEVALLRRLPGVVIVGLPAAAVRETAERVRSAIAASGYEFPRQRVVVAISPTDAKRSVPQSLDLPIAVAILAASGQVPAPQGIAFSGELSLSGEIRYCRGTVAAAVWAERHQYKLVAANGVAWGRGCPNFLRAASLRDVCAFLRGLEGLASGLEWLPVAGREPDWTFGDVTATAATKRALQVALAGGHDFLMVGPPGTGKTALARHAVHCLPAMTPPQVAECLLTFDLAGMSPGRTASTHDVRPFRAPHHSISLAGMTGGDRPGELDLASHGVLFMDEVENVSLPVAEAVIRSTAPVAQVIYAAGSPPEDPEDRGAYWRSLRKRVGTPVTVHTSGPKDRTTTPWAEYREGVSRAWRMRGEPFSLEDAVEQHLRTLSDTAKAAWVEDVARSIAYLDGRSEVQLSDVDEALGLHPDATFV